MSACKQCTELYGDYTALPQFNCVACWKIITKELQDEKLFRATLWFDHEKLREELDRCYAEIGKLQLKLVKRKVDA